VGDPPPWPPPFPLLPPVCSIKVRAAGIEAPAGLDNESHIVKGVEHFAEYCAVCHGAPGVPQGDLAEGLNPRPPNLVTAARFYTSAELFWIVKHGVKMTGMPSWGDHSDDELWATVAFVRKLPGMTEQDYAKLLAASRAQGAHHHEPHEIQPRPGTAQPMDRADHDHPADHRD
jgi:mono/diheme cytochrome c family protein